MLAVAGMLASCAGPVASGRPRLDGYGSQFTYLKPLETVQPALFQDAEGKAADLGKFRGKIVLVNFWATWCPPCTYEMPMLDRLQAELGGDRFAVVAIAIDTAGLPPVAAFFRQQHLSHLAIYLDPRHRMISSDLDNTKQAPFALYGLPITYLIDEQGRAVGYLKGAADWDSSQAKSFMRHFLGDHSSPSERL